MEKLTIENFIEKASKVHGDKYDYSKVDLEHRDEKGRVCIICPIHGEFWQNPSMHIHGNGCRKCKYEKQRASQMMAKEEFIEKAKKVHGDKYDYSKVEYKGNKTPVCIICPKHGEFWQKPNAHLNGEGCKKCYGNDVLTTEEFIKRAKEVHGDKYDYSKVEYKGARKRVKIVCPEHGEFEQLPFDHLDGHGCKKCFNKYKCGKSRQLTTEEFIKRAKEIHGENYDYSKVNYVKNTEKVCIICTIHGEFWQKPNAHLNGEGCPKCGGNKRTSSSKLTMEEFIEKAKKVHGDKYDYSKVEYKGNKTKVCIICPEHGEFWQTPNAHLLGQGCPRCSKKMFDKDSFIECARNIHGDKYDYSKVEYKGNKTKVCIICPEHGEFWQTPSCHINQKCGCPSCSESHMESELRKFFKEKNINFEREKMFNWLGLQKLDFYLPAHNIAIECQGIQHFEDVPFFNKGKRYDNYLSYIKKLDKKKKELCEKHEVKLYYINFNDNIYEKINEVLDGKL